MGWDWIVWIVLGNFSHPSVHTTLERIAAGASGQVFSERSKGTPRMLELATVRPLLRLSREVIVPGEGCSTVLTPNTVMGLKVSLYNSI